MPEISGRPSRRQQVRVIREELVKVRLDGIGTALVVLPVIPEDAPYRVREGIARRRLVAVSGACPCGARLDLSAATVGPAEAKHDQLCPAITDRLVKAIRRWSR